MKKDWDYLMEEVKKLPNGKELGTYNRYTILLHCTEKIDKLRFWEIKKKKFYKAMFNQAF